MQSKPTFWQVAGLVLALWSLPVLAAGGLYAQLVFSFDEERPFEYRYDKGEHALILELKNTSPSELDVLDHYDERLIRRVLVKDLSPMGTEVKFILRDRDVRAHVNKFQEPYRITLDIFDANYEEQRDPQTGLPMIGHEAKESSYKLADEGSTGGLLVGSDSASAVVGDISVADRAPESTAGKRRLLQPTPKVFVSAGDLTDAIRNAKAGLGPAWDSFPPYIYRIQTAVYEAGSDRSKWNQAATKAMNSVEAMADYAGQLFSLGHENRAYVAYQQVLHNDPTIFDRDALHLWKFAEVHLGQGNMTLARGYYQSLVEKHPGSPLAQFARMRVLDLAAIRLLQRGEYQKANVLLPELANVQPRQNGELSAQVAIRKAYWQAAAGKAYEEHSLPVVSRDVYDELAASYGLAESRRTKFYASNLILAKMLSGDMPWSKATGEFAANYMDTYQGDSVEPYRGRLKTSLTNVINKNLQAKVSAGELVQAVRDFEALPRSLKYVERNAKTAWALAEAYRKLGRMGDAVNLYATAAEGVQGADKFKAQFWLAESAGTLAAEMKKSQKSDAQVRRLEATSRQADRDMKSTWDALTAEEKNLINTAYKAEFEDTVVSPVRLRTPPMIVLENWTGALATKSSVQSGGELSDAEQHFSPSGSAVILLSNLAKRFSELGLSEQRRDAIQLLRHMKPSQLGDDQAAKKLWANELIDLAEDYRKNNQYLDAGRLFGLVGKEAENFEGRAESLYKSGLLLYRAGRRQEAIASFQEAANDGNNVYYSNLARERLTQIQ